MRLSRARACGPSSWRSSTAAAPRAAATIATVPLAPARVSGRVQGVGFRWWTRSRALELGLSGSATNTDDGSVEVVAQGPRDACERLLALMSGGGTPGHVRAVASWWSEPRDGVVGFEER